MSVLVKGIGMPKNCFGCKLFELDDKDLWCIANRYAGCCRALSKYIDENKFGIERHPDCPLVEVPAPHGRLIDADKFVYGKTDCFYETEMDLKFADTVIEAEE